MIECDANDKYDYDNNVGDDHDCVGDSLKKLGIKPPYDPAIPFLGIYLEETKIEDDTLYLIVHCSTIYNS